MIIRTLKCNFILKGMEDDEEPLVTHSEPALPRQDFASPNVMVTEQAIGPVEASRGQEHEGARAPTPAMPSASQIADRVYVLMQEDLRRARLRGW